MSTGSFDDWSSVSSIGSGSQIGGGQQRVAAAGFRQCPVVPPIGETRPWVSPPLAADGGGQMVSVPMSEYNQLRMRASQANVASGYRGRGRVASVVLENIASRINGK